MAAAIATMAAWSGNAAASGFALILQNGSGLGNAYAGATAGAEDASTVFFNPAGMEQLHGGQLALAGSFVNSRLQLADAGSVAAAGRPLGGLPDGGDRSAFIPAAYFVKEIRPGLHFGTGVGAPFGSKTEYPADWQGRYQAVKSSVETLNLNPSLSWQVNDTLSFGAGLNYQKIKASLSNAIILAPAVDGMVYMEGKDAAWGYNFGGLLKMESGARIGFAYRSPIRYTLAGTMTVTVANSVFPVTADLTVPGTWSLGYFRPLGEKWDVMADLSRTGWSSFKELRVVNAATGATVSLTPENWKDTWRGALGASYHYNPQWTARVGLAYDVDPVPEGLRTARLPDSDRTTLSLGGQYRMGKADALDFGYAHVFVKRESINRNVGGVNVASTALYGQVAGNFDVKADILSVQYTHGF